MYVGDDFTPSDAGEDELYTLDFVNDLASGETLSTSSWACEVIDGTDSAASSHVSGPSSISGTMTSQRFNGFVSEVTYRLTATVTTSLGNTKKLWSHVKVETPD